MKAALLIRGGVRGVSHDVADRGVVHLFAFRFQFAKIDLIDIEYGSCPPYVINLNREQLVCEKPLG